MVLVPLVTIGSCDGGRLRSDIELDYRSF
jgi:hypothetical protein